MWTKETNVLFSSVYKGREACHSTHFKMTEGNKSKLAFWHIIFVRLVQLPYKLFWFRELAPLLMNSFWMQVLYLKTQRLGFIPKIFIKDLRNTN